MVCGVPGLLRHTPVRAWLQAAAKLSAPFLRLYNGTICTGCLAGMLMVTGCVSTCLGFLLVPQRGHAVCVCRPQQRRKRFPSSCRAAAALCVA